MFRMFQIINESDSNFAYYYILFYLCIPNVYCFIEDYVNTIEESHTLEISV